MSDATVEIKTVVVTDVVDSTKLLSSLGDARAAQVFAQCDRLWRDLLVVHGGQEIDRTDGLLALFERPIDALRYTLAGHDALALLSAQTGAPIAARAGIHLGEVVLRQNLPGDVARGAKPVEVEGLAKPTAARLAALGAAGQTLLTQTAFDLARRASVFDVPSARPLRWLAHGAYLFKGLDEPVEVFEVGVIGVAPLTLPASSEKATRVAHDEATLGWRPAPGQEIPHRPNWIVEDKLGEGGFGEVWLAVHKKTGARRVFKFCFQADRLRALRREVTIFRLLKDALGSRDDIARILDWQFDEAPFFLEAEYTEGGGLSGWAERQGGLLQVPLPERLEIVAQVATALGAAHSVGVLHKDVKPANVLMVIDGGPVRARLTDFGLGLVQDRQVLLERAISVESMTEMVSPSESPGGTYLYMAPEVLEGKTPTIQADMYSLGVLLYQIVVGDFGRALSSTWARDVPDDLLREDIGALVDGSPDRRLANAAEVAERLRTLERRRVERFEEQRRREDATAARLELERARRRRKQVTAAAAVAGVVLLVVSVLAVQAIRARTEADFRRGQAEDLISFMVGDLRSKLAPVGRLDVLDEVGKKAMAYFVAIPPDAVTDADLMRRSKTLSQIGEIRLAQGQMAEALQLFQESLTIAKDVTTRNPSVPEWQVALGASHFWVADVLRRQGELGRARPHVQAYFDISKALAERYPDSLGYQLELGYAFGNLGTLREGQGDLKGALAAYQGSLRTKQRLAARDSGKGRYQGDLAVSHNKIGRILERLGDLSGALKDYQSELTIRTALSMTDPIDMGLRQRLAASHEFVGELLRIMGQADAAMPHLQAYRDIAQALSEYDPANNTWRRWLAVANWEFAAALRGLGRPGDFGQVLEADRAVFEHLAGTRPADTTVKLTLAHIYVAIGEHELWRGRSPAAAEAVRSAASIFDAEVRAHPDDRDLIAQSGRTNNVLGQAYAADGQRAAAVAAWGKAGRLVESMARETADWRVLEPWARSLLYLDRLQDARPVVERLLSIGYRERSFIDLCRQKGLPIEPPLAQRSQPGT